MLRLVKKYLQFLEKHTIFSAIIALSLVLGSVPFILDLEVKPSFQDILPDNHQSVKNIKKLTEIYGGEGFLIVGLQQGQKKELIEFARNIDTLAQSYQTIDHVVYKIDVDFFKENFLLYMELADLKEIERRILKKVAAAKAEANPLYIEFDTKESTSFTIDDIRAKYNLKAYREYLMDESQTSLLCLLKPNGSPNDVVFNRQLIADVDAIVESIQSDNPSLKSIEVEYGGLYYELFVDNTEILNDIFYLSILSISMIIIILLLHYRRFKTLVIIIFPLGVGILLNFALAQVLIGHLNMLTGFLSGILMGLGLDFSIHVYSRYLLEKQSRPWREALAHTLMYTGAASVGGALTTASAFYGITIAEFKGFSEFGLLAGNGMVLTALSIILIFPLVIVIYERLSHLPGFKIKGTLNQFSYKKKKGGFYKNFRYNYGYLRILFLLVVGFSIYFGIQVGYENNFARMKGKSALLRPFGDRAEAILGYSIRPVVVMSTNLAVLEELEKNYNTNIRNHSFEMITSCQSLLTFIPKEQEQKLVVIKRLKRLYKKYRGNVEQEIRDPESRFLLQSALKSKKVTIDNLPQQTREEFMSKDGKTFFLIIHPQKYIYRYIPKLEKFHEELNSVPQLEGQFQQAGLNFVLTSINQMVNKDAPYVLITTLACLFLTVLLLFRKMKEVFVIFVTLAFGILIMLGLMGFSDVKFNLLNVIALPMILGIGMDGAIHICHRLNEYRNESTHFVMDQVFKVLLLSSFTTALGFITLIGADYRGLRSIGW